MYKSLLKISSPVVCCVLFSALTLLILAVACSDDNPASTDLPELLLSPASIQESSIEGVGCAAYTRVRVDADPRGDVRFHFSCDAPWIELSNLAGTNYGTTSDSFSVSFSVASLPVGTYVDSVVVTSVGASNTPTYIEVTHTILPENPELRAWPPRFLFSAATPDIEIPPDTFSVTSTDGRSYDYTITETCDWFSLSKTSGTTPDLVVINVDAEATTWGGHVDTIRVSAPDLTNSPQMIACSLYINPWQRQTQLYDNYVLYDMEFVDDQEGWAVGLIMDDENWSGYAIRTTNGGEDWQPEVYVLADNGQEYGLGAIEIIGNEIWMAGQSGVLRYSPDQGETWENKSTGLADTVIDLQDIKFVTSEIGWIVGEDGLILKTTDGGDTWVEQISSATGNLWACHFIDEYNGYVVGDAGTILKTSNGGDSWIPMTGESGDYKDVYFVDENNGWIAGSEGIILYNDGGMTWVSRGADFQGRLQSVYFANSLVGWVAGMEGTVLYTNDAGMTWTEQNTGTGNDMYKVYFVDELKGWIAGHQGDVCHTNSGGY